LDYKETIEALLELEDRLVALESNYLRPAIGAPPGSERSSAGGVLRLRELPRPDPDRPVDEAAWWNNRIDKSVIKLEPGYGVLLDRYRFRSARWEGECLVIDQRGVTRRIVPLKRTDGKPIQILDSRVMSDERNQERQRLRESRKRGTSTPAIRKKKA
jgi:hypothetical protein